MTVNTNNRGRIINFVNGITGVAAGGNAIVNLDVNQRYHRIVLQCTATNYTAPTALFATSPGGTPATFTVTATNGAIISIAIATPGVGQTPGNYNLTITDPTGAGATATVVVAGGGTVVALPIVTSGGIPSPIDPATLITSLTVLVNGVNMRDISVNSILRMVFSNGYMPQLGELPIFFTPPWRNVNQQNEVTSWDLFGQSTFSLQLRISPNVISPGIVASQEFDYFRNVMPDGKGGNSPYLQPTAQHEFSLPVIAGVNNINTLPYDYPISRVWMQGSTPGSITQLDVLQDANVDFQATIQQLKQMYGEYGFTFGKADWFNTTYSGSNVLKSQYQPPLYYDAAFISDPDQRWWKALKCSNSYVLRVTSSVAQSITFVQETLPGAYQ